MQVYWIDFEEERRYYARVRAGQQHWQHTYARHVWLSPNHNCSTWSGNVTFPFLTSFAPIRGVSQEFIDGWNHLYLFDAKTGCVKNQITKGEWVVRRIERVDEAKRQIWFQAGGIRPGQDPYYIHLCRVNFDPNHSSRCAAAGKYPVIEQIYAGPHRAFVPKSLYPYMDLTRAGIYGGSAGGQSALRALLAHGDFYKVAVADCGCHDNRMDKICASLARDSHRDS